MLEVGQHAPREVPMFRGVRGQLTCISQPPTNEERRSPVDAFKEESEELIPLRPDGSAGFGDPFTRVGVGFPFWRGRHGWIVDLIPAQRRPATFK